MPLLLGNTAASYIQSQVPAGYVTDGLVFFVDGASSVSYPGSGSTWYDLSGKNNHLTINGASFVGSYFNFSGGVDGPDAISGLSNDFNMRLVDWSLTWTVFGDTTMNSDTYYHDMIAVGVIDANGGTYNANMWRSGLHPGAMYSAYGTESSFGSYGYQDGGSFSPRTYTGKVTHAVVTRSGNTMSYYINGVFQVSYTINYSGSFVEPASTPGTIALGGRNIGNHHWIGSIYQASFYRQKALNSTEVTQNWNMVRTRFGL